ncbi:MAG TPA: O-antigen ligase family protein [Gaiella sp.]|uniref:O-antigen ligase family protein n=1 Tax=Gaiella sp. TaxID=2663207 RepID=UPI002D7EF34A|nr:O-antigen ligase family protein [Gaiella sp.]HET9286512.1 O-antigen ligase family protein [Gaiella sp.]
MSGLSRLGPGTLVTGLVAAAVLWVAYDNGSYGLASRSALAIVVWWGLIVGLVFGLMPRDPIPRVSLVVGALVAALALWTLASLFWTADAEATFDEFNRVTLYLGTFTLVALGSRRSTLGRWADGLAVAIAAVAAIAITSRLFPGSFPEGDLPTFLPGAVTRLSFPLGYWNGLAIFVALGVPLLLRLALVARNPLLRGLALAPMPVIATTVYLTSSRGGVVTVIVGSLVFIALTERRWAATAALGASLLGAAAAVALLLDRDELVNGPLGTDLVERQGRSAALLIGLSCVATSSLYGLGVSSFEGRVRLPAWAGRVVVLAALLLTAIWVVVSDPIERFRHFKALPGQVAASGDGGFVQAHLLSGNGSGRWQFWSAALDQWNANWLVGDGAGSYASWWSQHASFSYFVRDAHSLYLEALGELGVLGLVLIAAVVVVGVATGGRRSWRVPGEAGLTTASVTAVFTAYGVALGFEWMWELTAVSVVGFASLALITGPATERLAQPRIATSDRPQPRTWRPGFGFGVASLAVAWGLICAQAIPLLANREVARSQRAARALDLEKAVGAAKAARDIQPWAATPYLQLALVSEQGGALSAARMWIEEAIERDGRNWRLWLVAARLETKLGQLAAAERSLRRAVELNPRSPLFQELLDEPAG